MDKIDYRKRYILVLDTETANTFTNETGKLDTSCALAYDIGWAVCDTKGNIYEKRSFVNTDVFCKMPDVMRSAYYANKIPRYIQEMSVGKRKSADTLTIRQAMKTDVEKYRIKFAVAHNARFDVNTLNMTLRYCSKSKYRYWLPFGIEIWDSMMMAQSVIAKMPTYRQFCEEHGYITKTGRLSMTAENLYRFITKNTDFAESHTGLEDVLIEYEIAMYCYKQHKPMKKVLYQAK